ncbi:MAG: hypothetical protein KatS3mg068_2685 [Candidatus Sericytochromatia bacterium]|nr:MAG: hypothetical protein KatS3mg068_2685 [Candidatus Sericytochromatia bacterium]
MSKLRCKKCGSDQVVVQTVTIQKGKTQGFSCLKGIIGSMIFPIIGWFCGLCGMGKGKFDTKLKTIRTCQNCGYQW